jgi:type IV pilus assembly protein PilQ
LVLSKIVSNPKIFTLDNETATITQGLQIPYTTTSDGETQTEFKDADLKLEVTPSIVGDGNIIMSIDINKDNAGYFSRPNPPISSTKVTTATVS